MFFLGRVAVMRHYAFLLGTGTLICQNDMGGFNVVKKHRKNKKEEKKTSAKAFYRFYGAL